MPSKTDLNVAPYYDDFSEDKKFHRVLYRPAFAVQARELTTQQTILQNQLEQFGDHMFAHGAMVIPGQISYDNRYYAVKLTSFTGTLTNYNANTLTQTGGVSLGNANVANSFYRDSVAAAMQKNALFTSMEGDTLKYFNSTKKYFPGLDDRSAFEYIQNNGAFNDGGVLRLDYSASGDFTALGPPNEFTFTGDNISKTIDTYNINTNLGAVNKIADGDAFEMPGTESGGILSKKNVAKAAIETAKNWLASDNNTQQSLLTGGSNRLNVVSGAYDGTNVTKAAGGEFLTEAQRAAMEGATFNIAGSN